MQSRSPALVIEAGPAIPVDALGEYRNTGFNVVGGVALSWTESLRVRFELSYNRTSLDRDAFLDAAGVPAAGAVRVRIFFSAAGTVESAIVT